MVEVNEVWFKMGEHLLKGENIEVFCGQDLYVMTLFDERSSPPFSGRGISCGGGKGCWGQNEDTEGWVQQGVSGKGVKIIFISFKIRRNFAFSKVSSSCSLSTVEKLEKGVFGRFPMTLPG